MHDDAKVALKLGLSKCAQAIRPLVARYPEEARRWRRQSPTSWEMVREMRPDVSQILAVADGVIAEQSEPWCDALMRCHPRYNGMVGCRGGSMVNLGFDKTYIMRYILGNLLQRKGFDEWKNEDLDACVLEVEQFIDSDYIEGNYWAVLRGFKSTVERINMASGLYIRPLTDDELSELRGASLSFWPGWLDDYRIVGEYRIPKVFGTDGDPSKGLKPVTEEAREKFDSALLALRTFQAGNVAFDGVHFEVNGFCPVGLAGLTLHWMGDPSSSFAIRDYQLKEEQVGQFLEHESRVKGPLDWSMELACSRLADASTRAKPRDQLLDAIIGMESLLLAALGEVTGELVFRFSLHYASFYDTREERLQAFRRAKHLYGLRSKVAHGSEVDEPVRVGRETMSLKDAAKEATEALRFLVHRLLPLVGAAPYKEPAYWEKSIFDATFYAAALEGTAVGTDGLE